MIEDAERLSRLLDGDLTEAEAAELRRRLQDEPELRALWETVQALPSDLAALPAIAAPTPARGKPLRWAVALAAATLAFVVGRASAPPATVQFSGADLTLRGATVAISQPEEDPMNRSFAAGGLTVGLISGAAWLAQPGQPKIKLTPGESAPLTRLEPTATRTPSPPSTPAAPAEAGTTEMERLSFENALLRIALARHEGEPHAFPEDYPAELGPRSFDDTVRPLVEADEDLELYGIDCTEYPCLAWVEAEGPTDADWEPQLKDLKARLERHPGWENHWIWTMPNVQRDQHVSHASVGIMVHPGPVPEPVITRIEYRARVAVEERRQVWAESSD